MSDDALVGFACVSHPPDYALYFTRCWVAVLCVIEYQVIVISTVPLISSEVRYDLLHFLDRKGCNDYADASLFVSSGRPYSDFTYSGATSTDGQYRFCLQFFFVGWFTAHHQTCN